jgi:hypothetical protein
MQTPLIGILASDGPRHFHGARQNFIDLIRMGQKLGELICVVTPQSFRRDRQTVQGYVWQGKAGWTRTTLLMPRVIYNRIPNRKAEQRAAEQATLRHLTRNDAPLFNARFFNKQELYRLLRDSEWYHLIPQTQPLAELSTLRRMLAKHPVLFAKPVHGLAGIGMGKISKQSQQYLFTYQDQHGSHRERLTGIPQLWQRLQQRTQHKTYVLQQGIHLATHQHRPCDFRVLLQKDGSGKWQFTGVGVRVAGQQAISTHVPMGGRIADAGHVLRSLFPQHHDDILRKLAQRTLGIARYIEQQQGTLLGEMSMDIGIESTGRMWFFEANAKPMKFDEPEIRRRSLQNLIHYARYLSKNHATRGINQ